MSSRVHDIGFTGTQRGLTETQLKALQMYLLKIDPRPVEAHHGDCVGADSEFHAQAVDMGIPVVLHPATGVGMKRAFNDDAHASHVAKAPLVRNHDIVNSCDVLIACPGEMQEVLRSGTWATIRYALKRRKHVAIIFPDGSLFETDDKKALDAFLYLFHSNRDKGET